MTDSLNNPINVGDWVSFIGLQGRRVGKIIQFRDHEGRIGVDLNCTTTSRSCFKWLFNIEKVPDGEAMLYKLEGLCED